MYTVRQIIGWCLLALTGIVSQVHAQDATIDKRALDVQVTRVILSGKVTAHISQGETPALTLISSKGENLSNVTTSQSGDSLLVAGEDHLFVFGRSKDVEVNIVLPKLTEVSASSLGDIEVKGFSGDELRLRSSGIGNMSGDLRYKTVKLYLSGLGDMRFDVSDNEKLEANLSGTGHIKLSGKTSVFEARLGGLGNLDAEKLTADIAIVNQGGVGNATLTVLQDVTISSGGMGTVTVYGQPEKRQSKTSGLSKIIWK